MAAMESFGCLRVTDHDLTLFNMGKHCTQATSSICELVILKIKFLKQGRLRKKWMGNEIEVEK